jgi:hypothetical protein
MMARIYADTIMSVITNLFLNNVTKFRLTQLSDLEHGSAIEYTAWHSTPTSEHC